VACRLSEGLEQESGSPAGPLDGPGTAGRPAATDFKTASVGKVLETLADSLGGVPCVLLADTHPDDSGVAVIKPASSEMPAPGERGDRYLFFGEIARGGMGAILKGRDADLGRDLAVKVLLEEHRGKPDLARRFVEEAQIGGQLQHPGIVPVYELGTFADCRPYFTMKLVKGRTLAVLLSERKDPRDDLARFLAIFEQVAQTVAYAHARGVIHRDLKPSNVMVGSFGEVQLMDWGLAKVLKEGGAIDDARSASPPVELSVIRTVRTGSGGDESQAGSVLGTPSYMAPEQASGDIQLVDRRADVFGLGSILCEILTGQPAYIGRSYNEVFRQALRGDTSDAHARLAGCGADADLVALAGNCLAAEPADRPSDAAAVAGRITAYMAGVQEKLRTAERERAVAETRAVEERRRRKLQVGLAAAVLALTTVGGLSTTYYLQQKQAHTAAVGRILAEATTLRDHARAHPEDLSQWRAALGAIRRVEDVLATDGGGTEARAQLAALRNDVQAGSDRAERDRRLLDRLVDIRSGKADDPAGTATDAAYSAAFSEAGFDLAALSPARAGEQIRARPPATALALAAALDDWASVRWRRRGDRPGAKRLAEAAQVADPDPWRRDLRIALHQTDNAARRTALQAAARSAQLDTLGAVSLDLLGTALDRSGDVESADRVLRAAQQRHPGDVWINYDLGQVCQRLSQRQDAPRPDTAARASGPEKARERALRQEDALRFYTAARAIRPETAHALGHLLEHAGRSDEAIAVFRDLVRLRPRSALHLTCLGCVLTDQGRVAEARPYLDAGIEAGRAAIQLLPNDAQAHHIVGMALRSLEKLDDAAAEYRAAIRLQPGDSVPHCNLGIVLRAQGKLEEAVAEYRTAIRLEPDDAMNHNFLGNALTDQGKYNEAIAEFRTAIGLKPDYAIAHSNLGHVLKSQGKLALAIDEFHAALRLQPDLAQAHSALGLALSAQGKHDDAVAECRVATRLQPDTATFHYNLAIALKGQGRLDAAVDEYRTALRQKPDYAEAHINLGQILLGKNRADAEGLALLRRGHELGSKRGHWPYPSAEWLRQAERAAALEGELQAVRLKPDDALANFKLGVTLRSEGRYAEAIERLRQAIRVQPDHAEAHGNLAWALLENGQREESIAAGQDAVRLNPNLAWVHNNLGRAFRGQGKLDLAVDEYRAVVRLTPDDALAHNVLGNGLYAQGKLDLAIAEYQSTIKLKPDFAIAHNNLGNAFYALDKLDLAVEEHHAAIKLKPDLAEAHGSLGKALRAQGKLDEAIGAYRAAIELQPKLASFRSNLGDALRKQGKLQEALAAFRQAGELATPNSSLARDTTARIRQTEQMIAVAGRLPAVLKGEDTPRDTAEALALGQLCVDQGRYATAARLWAGVLAADPRLGEDRQARHRYNAACYAARAGCGMSRDGEPPDDQARAALRQQALDWLKAERAAWEQLAESGPPPARASIVQTLKHWQHDEDLAGVRDGEALARLPEEEQNVWRQFWSDVETLRTMAAAGRP
jgi:serine/threonine-protein kinase